jgi:hypothetical protein
MSIIKDLANDLTFIVKNIEDIAIDQYEEKSNEISNLNKEQLLNKKDAQGNPTPNYSPNNKKKRGKLNFYDKGNFQQGIKPLFEKDGIDVISTDFKNSFLNPYKHKPSNSIVDTLGLSPSSIETLNAEVSEEIIKAIKQLLK